ncbi:sulfotransferase family protein [Yangia sp. PrR003]|nr:sulfotransferase family protein [Salipiger sp. PrR003]
MTDLLRYVRSEDVTLPQNKTHGFAAHYALVHHCSGAVYRFIPKNACSRLRYSMAVANKCIESPEDRTWLHLNNSTFAAILPEQVRAPLSFVVLRYPHVRLASVFLDKTVENTPELWQLYRLTSDGFDPDALTFHDVVPLLDGQVPLKVNWHWPPQQDFLVYEHCSHVLALERSLEATPILQDTIGLTMQGAPGLTGHGTDQFEVIREGDFADVPIAALAEMNHSGRLPAHDRLDAGDMTLYAAHFGAHLLPFPRLLPTEVHFQDDQAQRYHPRRRLRHAALSHHHGRVETTASDLRQADDLLSSIRADAGRNSRDLPDHHTPGSGAVQAYARRRQSMGDFAHLRGAAEPRRAGAGFHPRRGVPQRRTLSAGAG